jgi:DNA-binding response OmpR family regulator
MNVLVIENEKKVATFIKRGLEEENYQVDVAKNGEEGLQKAMDGSFDLILLELALPTKDGLSIIREARAKNVLTPMLILSSKNSVEDVVSGLEAGADDYLKKPFAFPELLARVKALLRRAEQERGAEIRFADLRLDPVAHRVWRADKEIDLTSKEYRLIEFFMRNANQALTRTTIAENVWSEVIFDKFTNIIDVYMNYLRRKIDLGAETKLIHTVRGVGYILKEE